MKLSPLLFTAALTAAFMGGAGLMTLSPRNAVDEAKRLILERSISPHLPDEAQLDEIAIRGMLESLDDPHGDYASPEEVAETADAANTGFSDIGVRLNASDDAPIVTEIFPDAPAAATAIEKGDAVLAVNGIPVTHTPLAEIAGRIKGAKGTEVTLTLRREGRPPFNVAILRGTAIEPQVRLDVRKIDGKRFAVFRIAELGERSGDEFADAMLRMHREEAEDGIVLDLRGNPGGLVETAKGIACMWIPRGGLVLSMTGRDPSATEEMRCIGNPPLIDIPTIVLVNGSTGSAGEILAGALQDHRVAFLMGRKTFGKGTAQLKSQLTNGGTLRVTAFRWHTPSGRAIHRNGIMPDELLPEPETLRIDDDPELDHALSHLSAATR